MPKSDVTHGCYDSNGAKIVSVSECIILRTALVVVHSDNHGLSCTDPITHKYINGNLLETSPNAICLCFCRIIVLLRNILWDDASVLKTDPMPQFFGSQSRQVKNIDDTTRHQTGHINNNLAWDKRLRHQLFLCMDEKRQCLMYPWCWHVLLLPYVQLTI